MLIDFRDLRQRIKDAGRASGLNAGVRSWIKEVRRDYAWIEGKVAAIRHGRSELEARAALLLESKAVFADAIALPEAGLTAERKRRRAAREINTLATAALRLEDPDNEYHDIFVRFWRGAAVDFVDHPQRTLRDRDRMDELAAGYRALGRYGPEYRREQDRMRELGW